jgi:hypothetical protein
MRHNDSTTAQQPQLRRETGAPPDPMVGSSTTAQQPQLRRVKLPEENE